MTDNPSITDKFKAECDFQVNQPGFIEADLAEYVLFFYDRQTPLAMHKGIHIPCSSKSLEGIIILRCFNRYGDFEKFVVNDLKGSNFLRRAYKKDQTGTYKVFTGQKK